MAIFLKDPAATIDYAIDWDAGYLAGQSIVASRWAVLPDGLAVAGDAIETGRTSATLAGGLPGLVYHVTNQVMLSDGRSDERTLVVRVEDR